MFARSTSAQRESLSRLRPTLSRDAAQRAATLLLSSPVVVVAYAFVARPEALGAPVTKLMLMTFAACLLMTLGDLSRWFAKLAASPVSVTSQVPRQAISEPPPANVFDALSGPFAAAPESGRFG
jgi:hypothetical protein